MSEAIKKPFYAAALLDPSDLGSNFTPLAIADAKDNNDAITIAMHQAMEWLVANGIANAVLDIVKDGAEIHSLRRFDN
jgi:hypothetical protein